MEQEQQQKQQKQEQKQDDDNEQQSSNCPAPAISTYRLVVECCVKAQQVDAAVQILTLAIQRYKNNRNHKMNNMNHTENHNNHHQQQHQQDSVVVAILPSMYSFELVICFLCDKGRWRQALHLFNLMEELAMMQHQQQQNEQQQQRPTIQMANAVLIAMSRAGEVAQAKHLLHRLMRNNNNNKYKQQQQSSSSYHSSSSYWSLQPNIISYNALISVCANTSGRWKEAIQIYDWLVRTPGVQPDIYTYTNIIRAYGKGQQIRQAMTLFQVVQDRKIPCDVHIYTALIQAYATATTTSSSLSSSSSHRSNNNNYNNNNNNANHVVDDPMNPPYWRKALDLLDEMNKLSSSNSSNSDGSCPSSSSLVRLRPNAVTYNAAISACGNNLQWEKALELLQQMKQEPNCILPSKLIYNNVLTAMARASKQQIIITRSDQDDDDEIHKKKNNKKGNSIIWTHAKQLLHEMDEAGIEKDGFTYSAALTCCQDHWEEALALIDTMQQQKQKQQGVSSNYNIQTRRRRGGVKTRTGAATTTISIQPNKMAYTAAITSCGKAGQAQAALDLFRNITMPITTTTTRVNSSHRSSLLLDNQHQIIIPDRVMYNALFSALRSSNNNNKRRRKRRNNKIDDGMNETLVVWNLWDQMVQQGRPYRRRRPPRLLQQEQSLWNPLFLHHHHDGNNNDQKNSSSSILTTKTTTSSSSFSSSSSRFPISAMHIVTPDMITVTNAIGALNHMMIDNINNNNDDNNNNNENDTNHKEKDISFVDCVMDQIYCDAVELMCSSSSSSSASGNGNIRSSTTTATLPVLCVTKDKNTKKRHTSSSSTTRTTTSSWEVDLSGLSLPVARAACRHIFLQNILQGTTTTTSSSSSRLAQPTTQQQEEQQKQHQGKRKSMGWNTKLSPIQFRNLILRTGVGRAN